MTEIEKRKQLRTYKAIATGLFFLMMIVYILSEVMLHNRSHPGAWGYIGAFSEAAMVGALADWFAVTALFHHPLGLKIPHTNLIKKGQKRIGDNLGNFITENFLTASVIRNQTSKLDTSALLLQYLSNPKYSGMLASFILTSAQRTVRDANHEIILSKIKKYAIHQAENAPSDLWLKDIVNNLMKDDMHLRLTEKIARAAANYLRNNAEMIRQQVEKKSYSFIPKFIDDKIADKITQSLITFFEELEQDENHKLRGELNKYLLRLTENLENNPDLRRKLNGYLTSSLENEDFSQFITSRWNALKEWFLKQDTKAHPEVFLRIQKFIAEQTNVFAANKELQKQLNDTTRFYLSRTLVKNRKNISTAVSETVGNWQGDELSRKLELEVGKDLQFIRVNGTLVGGLVGLLIYTLSRLFSIWL